LKTNIKSNLAYIALTLAVTVFLVVSLWQISLDLEQYFGIFTLLSKQAEVCMNAAFDYLGRASRSPSIVDWAGWLVTAVDSAFSAAASMFALPVAMIAICAWSTKRCLNVLYKRFRWFENGPHVEEKTQ